jgi:antitoxin (DNA-binding transcriptional repressor) of toxin-antitoxin stability system
MYAKRLAAADSVHALNEVGVTEFRGNLAKYLKRAKAGRAVVVLERGEQMYVLQRIEPMAQHSVFGCMRERTQTSGAQDAVVGASEDWSAGKLP